MPTGDPREWDARQLQDWFKAYKDGKWAEHASNFCELNGRAMTDLDKDDCIKITGNIGIPIVNAWQRLIGASGTATLRWSGRASLVRHARADDRLSVHPLA